MGFAALNRGAVNAAAAPSPTACEIDVSMCEAVRSQIPELPSSHFLAMAYQTERGDMEQGDMGQDSIAFYYSRLSPEDRRTVDRWLKANAIVGAIFATGLIAMALMGSRSVGPGDAEVASRTKASDVAVSDQRSKQPGVVTTQDPKVRSKLF
jgi:hypothetical protein